MKILFICQDEFPNNGACTNILKSLFSVSQIREKIDYISIIALKNSYKEKNIK